MTGRRAPVGRESMFVLRAARVRCSDYINDTKSVLDQALRVINALVLTADALTRPYLTVCCRRSILRRMRDCCQRRCVPWRCRSASSRCALFLRSSGRAARRLSLLRAAQGRYGDDSSLLQLPMLTQRAVDELASVGIECVPELVAAAPGNVRRTLSRTLAGAAIESLFSVRVAVCGVVHAHSMLPQMIRQLPAIDVTWRFKDDAAARSGRPAANAAATAAAAVSGGQRRPRLPASSDVVLSVVLASGGRSGPVHAPRFGKTKEVCAARGECELAA